MDSLIRIRFFARGFVVSLFRLLKGTLLRPKSFSKLLPTLRAEGSGCAAPIRRRQTPDVAALKNTATLTTSPAMLVDLSDDRCLIKAAGHAGGLSRHAARDAVTDRGSPATGATIPAKRPSVAWPIRGARAPRWHRPPLTPPTDGGCPSD
jgi:hypothetical protein